MSTARYPILADEPVEVRRPRRRVRVIALLNAAAIILAVAAGVHIATTTAENDARARVAAERAERDRQVAAWTALLARYRADMCTVLRAVQPQTEEIIRLRREYQCDQPFPQPTR